MAGSLGLLLAIQMVGVVSGTFDMVFKVYDASTGGNLLWTGTYTAANGNAVTVSDGVFSVLLGSGTGNAFTVDFNQDELYFGVTVGTDSEMTPRLRMGAAAQAFTADSVFGTGQSAIGTTTPYVSTVLTIEATSTSAVPLAIRGYLNQVADLFRIITDTGTQLLTFTSGGCGKYSCKKDNQNKTSGISLYILHIINRYDTPP